jgi:hypothetical protein
MAHNPDPTKPLDRFKAIFAAMLSASKHEALQVIFSTNFDPVPMELNFDGLEHDTILSHLFSSALGPVW